VQLTTGIKTLLYRSGKVKDQESGNMGNMMVSLFNLSHHCCESYGLFLAPMKWDKHCAGFSLSVSQHSMLSIKSVVDNWI
jgi:hypothetical protein